MVKEEVFLSRRGEIFTLWISDREILSDKDVAEHADNNDTLVDARTTYEGAGLQATFVAHQRQALRAKDSLEGWLRSKGLKVSSLS